MILVIGAEDMRASKVSFEPGAEMTTMSVPNPEWISA
jgi:hypothetical protein